MIPGQRIWQSRGWLYRQYVTLGLTEEEIAKKAGTSRVTIHNWLEKFEMLKSQRRR